MPPVLCGLKCFDVPVSSSARDVAREFSASLNPALNGASSAVEVYRLVQVAPDVQLAADDIVVCSIPGWQFDFASLEDLHRQFEELRSEHENLIVQYSRTKEALISLNSSVEASEAADSRRGGGGDSNARGRREVDQLKLQLTQSEQKQKETKATVMALRNEFMHLVDMMTATGGPKCQAAFELPSVMREVDTNVKGRWPEAMQPPQSNICEADRPAGGNALAADAGKPRNVSQPPMTSGTRRPNNGSPRVYRTPATYTTPRQQGARPRGVHQRSGHSAGASMRQRGDGL